MTQCPLPQCAEGMWDGETKGGDHQEGHWHSTMWPWGAHGAASARHWAAVST